MSTSDSTNKIKYLSPISGKSNSRKSFNFSQSSLRGVDPFELVLTREDERLRKALSKCTPLLAEKFFFDRNENQLTPLGLAIQMDALDCVEAFLEHLAVFPNIDINHQDAQGYSLMHSAVTNASEKVMRRLLQVPALQVDLLNHDKNSPLHYFCEKYSGTNPVAILNMLLQKGR
jgi:ankyrin repeat protein